MYAPVPRYGLTSRVKGKEEKRGIAAMPTKTPVNKRRAVDYRVSNWAIY